MKRTAERGARRSRNEEAAYTEYDEEDYEYEYDDDSEEEEEEKEEGGHMHDDDDDTSLACEEDIDDDVYNFESVTAAGSSETFSSATMLKFLEEAFPSAARALRRMQSSVRPYAGPLASSVRVVSVVVLAVVQYPHGDALDHWPAF